MYSEQLAVLIFLAATQVAGQVPATQVEARAPRGGIETVRQGRQVNLLLINPAMQRQKLKRQREATLLAEFR
jgi:hypothetical protein